MRIASDIGRDPCLVTRRKLSQFWCRYSPKLLEALHSAPGVGDCDLGQLFLAENQILKANGPAAGFAKLTTTGRHKAKSSS